MTSEIQKSPPWGTTIKLVVGLTIVAILGGMLLYFRSVITSLLLAFILIYLFYPLIKFVARTTRLSWQASTAIIFVVMLLLFLGLLTITGFAVAQQLQSLLLIVQKFIADLPEIANELSQILARYGEFGEIINFNDLANRAIETLQPIIGQAGTLVRSIATGAATSIGKIFFVFMIAYLVLADIDKLPSSINISAIPDYAYDIRRIGRELRRIWNAFLRGQMIIFILIVIIYLLTLTILGTRYAFGLALLTGLGNFIPYVGAFVAITLTGLAAFFQASNYFGLDPWQYTILVLGIAFLIDRIFDSLIKPRFFGKALGIHPAVVLVTAIMAANLFGLVGLILAAPVVATLKLFGRYVLRKMLDLDPWPEGEIEPEQMEYPWRRWGKRLWAWAKPVGERITATRGGQRLAAWAQSLREKIHTTRWWSRLAAWTQSLRERITSSHE
ncbi:MAG: putative transport protein YhhT [Chloroflexi bacterium]|nr:putative transport protein YhhT [Chloroflexota bacterium]